MKNLMKMFSGAIICVCVMMSAASVASATTVDECATAINVVKGDLAGVVIGGNNVDLTRASLNSKLDGAILKLQQGKFSDALTKLTDFRDKIVSLQSQGKISDGTTTVTDLINAANAAIQCVQNLMAGI